MVKSVGYIGIGNMGMPISTNVLKAGFDLTVYDVRDEPLRQLEAQGAYIAKSPIEVGERCELIELSLVDDEQIERIVCGPGGVLDGTKPGSIIAIHSTIHPRTAKAVAKAAEPKGVGVLDAQVSGGQSGAWGKTLTYMVGGDRELFDQCLPVFQTSGTNIFHVGPVGAGSATKLAQQVMVCINRMSAYEGMMLAKRAGVDLETLQAVVHTSGAQSRVIDEWRDSFGHMGATPEAAAHNAHLFWKGLIPALELGHEVGLAMPATALVQQFFPRVLGLEEP